MISRKAEVILKAATDFARRKKHEYCTVEHLFWAMLEDETIIDIIRAFDVSPSELKMKLEEHLEKEIPLSEEEPSITLGMQNLLQRALFQVQSSARDEILPRDLFVALFQAKDSYSVYLLNEYKISRVAVITHVSHQGTAVPAGAANQNEEQAEFKGFESFLSNLNEEAIKGKIDPLIGRSKELERMIQTLCRRRKNNPLLVGEAGVGKTALAEGLAWKIVQNEVPDLLKNAVVFAMDIGSLLAGAKYRGDFEQRLKGILEYLQNKKKQNIEPILFIDEIHNLVGAGATNGGTLDAANMLKPLLAKGELKCIGSTTYTEYRNVFEKDHALSRRFQKIDVVEPEVDEAIQILKGLRPQFEKHHGIKITDAAIVSAVELSKKHLIDRFLPDKAIDLIDETGARARLHKLAQIDSAQIEEIVSQIARIPPRVVQVDQREKLKNLERDLKLTIFGQDHAIDSIVTAIKLSRSGLRSGEKPIGSFLFCGPTGVGKTELSKQLSHAMGIQFLRFDMSEYMEKHTVSRLIGAPPGYVGFDQAGLLTEAVRKNPHAVILLDEIEKAHQDVWNLLLQIMDHGALTDNYGRKADFKNAIVIMTSNVGARELEKKPLGITRQRSVEGASAKEVEKTFSPEFRNRLDAIIYFNPLNPLSIAQVVSKQLMELETQLLDKHVHIEISAAAREYLAKNGYEPTMGARPMARLIQEKLRKPLAEEILFGKLEKGGRVVVDLKDDKLDFVVTQGVPLLTTS